MPPRIELTNKMPLNSIQKSVLESDIIESLRMVYDPELPVNVYDLGLIYAIEISDDSDVKISMTLTSPACPVAESLPLEVEEQARETAGVRSARVELVWDPPFTIDRIPDHVKLELGLY
jgi:FeS assembly SUF system protein